MAEKVITVSQFSEYVGSVLLSDPILKRLYIKGEVSNCTYHSNGNVYFTLKDDGAAVKCIIFYDVAQELDVTIQDGSGVMVKGHVIHNKKDGSYSVAIKELEVDGAGKLYEEVELLKKRLYDEGLFDISHKKEIPANVKKIGVVTSGTGAVIRDIINVSTRRNKNIEIILSPAKVQGIGAEQELIDALQLLIENRNVDVIIIARGGGSYEDLNAFNGEKLARALFNCPFPTISAIGHEVDFTIADFVCDLRAPTPSAAAELAVSDMQEVLKKIEKYNKRLYRGALRVADTYRKDIDTAAAKLYYFKPYSVLNREELKIEKLIGSLQRSANLHLAQKNMQCKLLSEKLSTLSPLGVLKRGYAIVKDKDTGNLITTAKNVKSSVQVLLQDGIIDADVRKVQMNEDK